jgi:aspartate/methionine/tyrosine aminotransferase
MSFHDQPATLCREFVAERVLRIPRVGSREIDAKAEILSNQGIAVIQPKPYPSAPFPDFLIEVAERAIRDTTNPPSRGLYEFRRAVANTVSEELFAAPDVISAEHEVLTTAGGMHALYVVFSALLDEGDIVLVPSPCYFLEGIIERFGGTVQYVPMREEDDFRWDCELLERNVSSKTKLIFLNTPVNPTGYVLTQEDLERVAAIAIKHNLLVVADESYDKLLYDGRQHISIASVKGMRERTILVRSFTKSYGMPNYRVGFVVANKDLITTFTKECEWMLLYGAYVSQKVATAALVGGREWLREATMQLEKNRTIMCEAIAQVPGLSCVQPQAGPFMFPNISRLRLPSSKVSEILLKEFKVSSVPGEYFHAPGHFRIALGAPIEVMQVVLHRIRECAQLIGLSEVAGE